MLAFAAALLSELFGGKPEKKEREPERRASQTATMRALTDLGECIASSVHVIASPVRLYLCVAMEPKPEALEKQKERDRHQAAGMFEVDALWSAAEVNARWAKKAVLVDGEGREIEGATCGARGMTDAGAKEVFFEFNAMDSYPEVLYLSDGEHRIRVR